jgi:hypothetical protein
MIRGAYPAPSGASSGGFLSGGKPEPPMDVEAYSFNLTQGHELLGSLWRDRFGSLGAGAPVTCTSRQKCATWHWSAALLNAFSASAFKLVLKPDEFLVPVFSRPLGIGRILPVAVCATAGGGAPSGLVPSGRRDDHASVHHGRTGPCGIPSGRMPHPPCRTPLDLGEVFL